MGRSSDQALHRLIDAIGAGDFGSKLLAVFDVICGAEYCVVYHFSGQRLNKTVAGSLDRSDLTHRHADLYISTQAWQKDEDFDELLRQEGAPLLLHHDIPTVSDITSREPRFGRHGVVDRILMSDGADDANFVSLLRSNRRGLFSESDVIALQAAANVILSIVAKHRQISRIAPAESMALTSLDDIESCIARSPVSLPCREAQVCARILYGMTAPGIAIDLGIGEEIAMTYRKRANQRLNVGCQRELLLWLLGEWSLQSRDIPGRTELRPFPQRAQHRSHGYSNQAAASA